MLKDTMTVFSGGRFVIKLLVRFTLTKIYQGTLGVTELRKSYIAINSVT